MTTRKYLTLYMLFVASSTYSVSTSNTHSRSNGRRHRRRFWRRIYLPPLAPARWGRIHALTQGSRQSAPSFWTCQSERSNWTGLTGRSSNFLDRPLYHPDGLKQRSGSTVQTVQIWRINEIYSCTRRFCGEYSVSTFRTINPNGLTGLVQVGGLAISSTVHWTVRKTRRTMDYLYSFILWTVRTIRSLTRCAP